MRQEDILALLRNGKGNYISGEELSRRLQVSRSAIWKYIDALRQNGYMIEARTKCGYRLVGTPDTLSEQEIRSFMRETTVVGKKIYCFNEIDSTNTYARRLALEGEADGSVVVSDYQTAGRGRKERVFQSPKGKGIYLSALLRPNLLPERVLPVTAMTGVAVCSAVERICGVRPRLKWPNDPILGQKKLCGILTEAALEGETGYVGQLVVGIGVNVSQNAEDFSPEVAQIATSLVQELQHPVSRPQLAAAIIEELDNLYNALRQNTLTPFLDAFRRDCVHIGKEIRILNPHGEETVTAIGIDNQFGLIVRNQEGKEWTVRSGEVSVRGLFGYVE